jgi:hypothetical protein
MPLVGFRPTKARLIIEDNKDSVLVMNVVLHADDAVELSTGGTLKDLVGVLRIRERKPNGAGNGGKTIGAMVYVAETDGDSTAAAAKFQINVAMATEKFAMLLRVANAGRLPTKFFVDAGQPPVRGEAKGLGYRIRVGERVKVWENHAHRTLPVTNFVMILPIDVSVAASESKAASVDVPPVAVATNAQVAELMDDMLVFQSDTRTTMFGFVCVLGIIGLAALAISVSLFYR